MLGIAVLAVFAVARFLQFLLGGHKNWKVWDGDHGDDVSFLEYLQHNQMKVDLLEYFYWSCGTSFAR